ncbi:RNA ligase 2 [Cotonvirus japonicus]|uniref:RNA ligase 2 n=1 Tax=Cotonvirus japonicus TaxID=2811091 RepID=A0ABM7NS17_9VIRU|nr:RNA ligase 2 [Cotonvirus japonicus]BCS82955.1 RNA ligase 2 [Cotonvirus japonicus]
MSVQNHFAKYSSIENVNAKNIKTFRKLNYINSDVEWIALEKIHGANFSYITDGKNVTVAKRSSILLEDENFYGHQDLLTKYYQDILIIFSKILEKDPTSKSVQVFGELFGGYFPGFNKFSKSIQKGVYYSPDINFLVFDIKVNTDLLSYFISYDDMLEYLTETNLKSVPLISRATFDVIVNLNPVFNSNVPKLYGLPDIENNYAEGYVFKTNEQHSCNKPRPIIKSKNNAIFGEVDFVPKKHETSLTISDPVVNKYVSNILPYITQNRFDGTIGKIGPDNPMGKICGMFVADAVDDYEKELHDDNINEFNKLKKKIKGILCGYLMENQIHDLYNYHVKN